MASKTMTQTAATIGSKQLLLSAGTSTFRTGHGDHAAGFHGLRMNWLAVMDGKGNRRPQICWQVR